jgi:hypothetical protein
MAKTAKAEKTETAKAEKVPEQKSAIVGGIAAEDLEVLEGSIDDRMAALLKDHQEMGVRPKE